MAAFPGDWLFKSIKLWRTQVWLPQLRKRNEKQWNVSTRREDKIWPKNFEMMAK